MNSPLPGMNDVFSWLLSSTVQVSILILLVLAVRRIFRKWLSPRWCYFLWLLVIARMIIPFSWESHFLLPEPCSRLTTFLTTGKDMIAASSASGSAPAISSEVHQDAIGALKQAERCLIAGLPLFWLFGGAFLLGRLVFKSTHFAREIAAHHPATGPKLLSLLQSSKDEIGVRHSVALIVTSQLDTPMLYGYIRPKLLLPLWMAETFNNAELRYVMLHELGHVRRHDIAINWVISVLQIVHWFNPLIWIAVKQMRIDREQACDHLVLSRTKNHENIPYGETILKLLGHFNRQNSLPGLVGILEYQKEMKMRIKLIRDFGGRSKDKIVGGVVLLIALGILGFTSPGIRAENLSQSEEKQIYVTAIDVHKIDKIIIPRVDFRGVTVHEALDFIEHRAREFDSTEKDPARKGVNILLKVNPDAPEANGRITLTLDDASVHTLLKYLAMAVNLKLVIEPSAVETSPKS